MLKHILKVTALLLTLIGISSVGTHGQSFKAEYTYDNNGNRLTAKIIYLTVSSSSAAKEVEEDLKTEETPDLKVKIFPNPTEGNLRVDVVGGNKDLFENSKNCIKVWDIQGWLIISFSPLTESNQIDLTQYGNGTYIMHLTLNGTTKSYKIIKN